jgi:hypothetical protein
VVEVENTKDVAVICGLPSSHQHELSKAGYFEAILIKM